jgi:hypothetical protein
MFGGHRIGVGTVALVTVRSRTESPTAPGRFVREYAIERLDELRTAEFCDRFAGYSGRDSGTGDRRSAPLSTARGRTAPLEHERPLGVAHGGRVALDPLNGDATRWPDTECPSYIP